MYYMNEAEGMDPSVKQVTSSESIWSFVQGLSQNRKFGPLPPKKLIKIPN